MKTKRTNNIIAKAGASLVIATALGAGSFAVASAATSSPSGSGTPSQPGVNSVGGAPSQGGPGGPMGNHGRPPCPKSSACSGGKVISITPNAGAYSIVVQDPMGFWHTIVTNSQTTFSQRSNGTSSAVSGTTIVAGDYVRAQGSVDVNHTTLDASSVSLLPGPPVQGQGLPGGASPTTGPSS